ncbi:MAG: hypothetical protein IBJ03_12030 [Gemmatimonadaceae bacterium]|nr:hypothetical protein [Gemmatimonadaceae bacterium]
MSSGGSGNDDRDGLGGPGSVRKLSMFTGIAPPVQVVGFIATRKGDADRGPMVRMRSDDALIRLVSAGELVRVVSARRSELAVVELDDSLPRGGVVLRDVAGAAPSEVIRIIRLDTDSRPRA